MTLLIVDLEWNGAWSKKAHGYFNEIIEIGAVKLDEHLKERGTYHAVIRPQVSKKLSSIVTDLTNITDEELSLGTSFHKAMAGLRRFAGGGEVALVTWSNTDLSVMMENCRFFYGNDHIDGFTHYADLQAYCQKQMGIDSSHQPSLDSVCEALGISEDGFSLHRAGDDARLTAEVCQKMYDATLFAPYLREMNEEFYARALFKVTAITDQDSPLIPKSTWDFHCPLCNRPLRRNGRKWQHRGRAFYTELACRPCQKIFSARVQAKLTFEGPDIRRKLTEKVRVEEPTKS